MMLYDGSESTAAPVVGSDGSPCLDVRIRFNPSLPLVRLSGELDVSSAHLVRDAVACLAAATCPAATVVVDLERVTFCDVAGLRALEDAAVALAVDGRELVLYSVPHPVSRVIALAGVAGLLNVHETSTGP